MAWGRFDSQEDRVCAHESPEPGDQDLVDLSAIQTLIKGGSVYAVSPGSGGVALFIAIWWVTEAVPDALMAAHMLDNHDVEIGFAQWMMIGIPIVVVSLPAVFFVLTRVVFPLRLKEIPGGAEMIAKELQKAGAMSRAEKMVGIVFGITAILWVTKPMLETYIPNLSDTGIAIFAAIVMFLLPVDFKKGEFVLRWADAKKFPWEVLILFGGGLSLAAAITNTGLAEWIGMSLGRLDRLPIIVLIMSSLLVIIFLTERRVAERNNSTIWRRFYIQHPDGLYHRRYDGSASGTCVQCALEK